MLDIIRYLLRHKSRTALTVLAVAVGMFAVTTVGGMAEGLYAILLAAQTDRTVYLRDGKVDREERRG